MYQIKQKIENNLKQLKNKKLKKLTPKSCGHNSVPSIISKGSQLFWNLWTQ